MQHKIDSIEGFTKKYKVHRLVYYESYEHVMTAIRREKQLKGWRRDKKITLIEKVNPRWMDLAEKLGPGNAVSGTVPEENALNRRGAGKHSRDGSTRPRSPAPRARSVFAHHDRWKL